MRRVTGALYGIWGMVSLFVSLVGVIQAATFNDGSFEAGDPFYRGVLIDGVIMIVILFLFSLLYNSRFFSLFSIKYSPLYPPSL